MKSCKGNFQCIKRLYHFNNNKFIQFPKYYIGYGASAIVYCAIYKPLNKRVAVKMIDLDFFERNQIDEVRVLYIRHYINRFSILFVQVDCMKISFHIYLNFHIIIPERNTINVSF